MKNGMPLVPLKDVCEAVKTVDPKKQPTLTFRYVDLSAIDKLRFEVTAATELLGSEAPSRARQRVREGDVILATTRPYLRGIARISETLDGAICSTGFCVLRPSSRTTTDWLFHAIRSDAFMTQLLPKMRGATYPAVSDADVLGCVMPMPKVSEQERIGGKINEALARVSEMERVREDAAADNQSLLASALRVLFQPLIESGSACELGDLTIRSQYGTNAKCSEIATGLAILRIPNVADGRVNFDKLKYAHLPDRERQKVVCAPGDLLIVRTNGSSELVGRCAVLDVEGEWGYASYLIRFRLHRERGLPEYVSYFLRSPQGREHIARIRQTSAGQFNVNSENLRSIPIPLPTLSEQAVLVETAREVERTANLTQIELSGLERECAALRQAILREAFAGNL